MKPTAILCPGPSLPTYWEAANPAEYGSIVGVNTAGHVYIVDWLAFADWHIINPIRSGEIPPPRKGLICKPGMAVVPNLPFADLTKCFPDLGVTAEMPQDSNPLCGYTFPNALAWVQHRTHRAPIHVFGFDASPSKVDFAGQAGDHSANRWYKEMLWVKAAWGPNVSLHSQMPVKLKEWLFAGHSRPNDLMKILACLGL